MKAEIKKELVKLCARAIEYDMNAEDINEFAEILDKKDGYFDKKAGRYYCTNCSGHSCDCATEMGGEATEEALEKYFNNLIK